MSTHIPASELAPENAWFKSSYSSASGNSCVEVASRLRTHDDVLVRDSKEESGPALRISRAGWDGLLGFVRTAEGDFGVI
ncbi:DUF397 domain-containing protein [Streptomyces sp. NPDC091292]|uniref:DUF397 domain-containing protein n=1 Tax=Streptomyces sp. NPDC091292 TaxID=3365991 RepID=UPI0038058BFC